MQGVDTAWGMPPRALYVHIPFCQRRCHYCDFATEVAPALVRSRYVDALIREFEMLAPRAPLPLTSVFFGGGTPSLLTAAEWERLLEGLTGAFRLADNAEVTVEVNPGTLDERKLTVWAHHGVNRLSFGAQTFNDHLLRTIGRSHDAAATGDAVRLARAAGFTRINLDLMFGLPGQTVRDVEAAVRTVVSWDVPHISAYWLKVEPGTPFARWLDRGLIALPGEDAEAEMYEAIRTMLGDAGYKHYEISNFARPGQEARHNLVYWRNEPYLAAGVAAHGLVHGERYVNLRPLPDYFAAIESGRLPVAETHPLTVREALEDTVILGLRLAEGVAYGRFEARHGVSLQTAFGPVVTELLERGWLEPTGDGVRIPGRLWPVANVVFERFLDASPAD